jgi:flagellin
MKIHIGPGNDSAEDYYYITTGNATLRGLGLMGGYRVGKEPGATILANRIVNGAPMDLFISGVKPRSFFIIPKGTKDLSIHIDLRDQAINDSIQLFTRDGKHLAGTGLGYTDDWAGLYFGAGVTNAAEMNSIVLTQNHAFLPGASYDPSNLNGSGSNVSYTPGNAGNSFTYNGMNIGYSGDGRAASALDEYLTINEATEDLILTVIGGSSFSMEAKWTDMPRTFAAKLRNGSRALVTAGSAIPIETQDFAQDALSKVDEAILRKDTIRAHLGALQNRLENTVSNIQIQAENIQAAESRISDVDVATEMTEFVRSQILADSATSMLAQANSLPQITLSLIRET